MTLADNILQYYQELDFTGELPEGIEIMNPFREDPQIMRIALAFYRRFYSDHSNRKLILGINPGRLGAGATGIPFTDPKRLIKFLGIPFEGPQLHEPSSVFIYEVIQAYGGVEAFYRDCYINSMVPLGFVNTESSGKRVNYNYYDNPELLKAVKSFVIWNIKKQKELLGGTRRCICLGAGKNLQQLRKLNQEHQLFDEILSLEHPRYIMQYQQKRKQVYIEKYLQVLRG